MSQAGPLNSTGVVSPAVATLTGNSGGAVGPDGANNINILGNNSSGINIIGTPLTNTLTVVAIQATTAQQGAVTLATNAQTIAGTDANNAVTAASLAAKLGTQTAHSLAIFEGTSSAITALGAATNGQLPIGSTGADPVLATLTSTGGTITITNGPGSINLDLAGGGVAIDQIAVDAFTAPGTNPVVPAGTGQVTITGAQVAAGTVGANVIRTDSLAANSLTIQVQRSTSNATTDSTKNGVSHYDSSKFSVDANGFVTTSGTGVLNTLTGNSGGAISPTAGNINTVGTGSITIAGAGSTLTTQLTGLTNHAIQIGAGTATLTQLAAGTTGQVLQTNTGADPTWSTATYPSTTTINQILYSSAANTVTGLATANRAVFTTTSAGVPQATALATDGQLIIGSTAGAPAAATLSAGAGISITNGSNSITIAVSGDGFTWSDTSGIVTAVAENGYFITAATTSTLPASPNEGDTIKYIVDTASALTITAAGTQKIRVGNTLSAAGGTSVNTQQGDAMTLVYRTTGTTWFADSFVGAWTTT